MAHRFLGVFLLLVAHVIAVQSTRKIFVSAPNIFRVGNRETVLINVFNTGQVDVTVTLKNADGSVICDSQQVQVDPDNSRIVEFFIDPDEVNLEDGVDYSQRMLYAKLEVSCPALSYQEESDVLLSFEEGFVFIQTDKPIYTPDQRINVRLIILDQNMRPSDQLVQMDIVTPQGVIVDRKSEIDATNGFAADNFYLPPEPLFGNWSVVVSYGVGYRSNRSVQFEVKEYVLPTFSVEVTTPDYILEINDTIDIGIEARYVYKKPVLGNYYVKVGILDQNGDITIKHKRGGELQDGMASLDVATGLLGDNWFAENVGKRLYVEVSVLETASGIFENTSDSSAKIAESPYVFEVARRTIMHYKKGLAFVVNVDLSYQSGRPAKRVPVSITVTSNPDNPATRYSYNPTQGSTRENGEVAFTYIAPVNAELIRITLETVDGSLTRGDQQSNAVYEFDMHPSTSSAGNEHLKLRVITENIIVSSDLQIEARVTSNQQITGLTYYVISRGNISSASFMDPFSQTGVFNVFVTYDMIPSFRIVAFYINAAGHVIADSVWVEESSRQCENKVALHVESPHRHPGAGVRLKVTGQPRTTVALLGVDKAVYLLQNFHRLTSSKMYKDMDAYDTGCGPGGGRDTASIFKNAGINAMTDANLQVGPREFYGCGTPLHPRRRRSVEEELAEYLAQYVENEEATFACRAGQRRTTVACEARITRFRQRLSNEFPTLGDRRTNRLVRIFTECCEEAILIRSGEGDRGRTGGNNGVDVSTIGDFANSKYNVRSDFRETWIFDEISLGGESSAIREYTSPDSITEWEIGAIGLSPNFAMCIARPLNITLRKDLFVQLHIPYSIVHKEQVEITATVFNYYAQDLEVHVFLRTTEAICSEGTPNEYSAEKVITVPGHDAASVRYVLIGLQVGEHAIEIAANSSENYDIVKKNLRVVPDGVKKFLEVTSILDPAGSLEEEEGDQEVADDVAVRKLFYPGQRKQINSFRISLPSHAVPGTEQCEVSVIGSILGPVVTAVTVVDGLGNLLQKPSGCGEQTMRYLTPNVYVLRYLTNVEAATPEHDATARKHIENGIIREQTYRKSDGSYAAFLTRPSSTWLTAFVNKVFCHALDIRGIFVQPEVICKTSEWLIINSQRHDGAFVETMWIIHRNMAGQVQGDAAFTAFVLISLHDCSCTRLSEERERAIQRATAYLEAQLDIIERPYALAIVTYALALVDSDMKEVANSKLQAEATYIQETGHRFWGPDGFSKADTSKPFWYRAPPSSSTLETTGYALLAQVELNEVRYSLPIAKWLSEQQNYGGGFASTQDTAVALQALTAYATLKGVEELDMDCSVEHDGQSHRFDHLMRENQFVQQTTQLKPVNVPFNVTSTGEGTGKLNVRVSYNSISSETNELPCAFAIAVEAKDVDLEVPPEQRGRRKRRDAGGEMHDLLTLRLHLNVSYLGNTPTDMAIIDVGIPSGFKPVAEDLALIVNTSAYISRHEASQRSVVFYADNIPLRGEEPALTFQFRVDQESVVGNLQPVPVKVYDYYNSSAECTKFYHPTLEDEAASRLQSICQGDVCMCAAGDCLDCGPAEKEALLERSCRTATTYAYKITVTRKIPGTVGFDVYNATIINVMKAADDIIQLDDVREFWLSRSCKDQCVRPLKMGNSYLAIGQTVLEYETKEKIRGYKYILDQLATLEWWPRGPSGKRKVNAQYERMQAFQADMEAGNNSCQ